MTAFVSSFTSSHATLSFQAIPTLTTPSEPIRYRHLINTVLNSVPSDNIRKLFQALTIHFEKHPDQRARFPGYTLVSEANSKGFTDQVPFLAKGEQRPLDGEMYTAKYFHGRWVSYDALVTTRLIYVYRQRWPLRCLHPPSRAQHPELLCLVQLLQWPRSSPPLQTYADTWPAADTQSIEAAPIRKHHLHRNGAAHVAREGVRDGQRSRPDENRQGVGHGRCGGRAGEYITSCGVLVISCSTSLFTCADNYHCCIVNWFADPFAVHNLLIAAISEATLTAEDDGSSGKREDITGLLPLEKFLMFPLDITKEHALPFDAYKKLVDPGFADAPSQEKDKSWLVHFTSSYLERVKEVMAQYNSKVSVHAITSPNSIAHDRI